MRTVYATSLEIRDQADISATMKYVSAWIYDRYRRQRLTLSVADLLSSGDLALDPAEGHSVSIRHYPADSATGSQLIDVRWHHPDQYDKSLGWSVALSLLRQADTLSLSLEVSVTGLQLVVAPANIKLGSPTVVRNISRLRSVFVGGYPYNRTPEIIAAEEVDLLVSELTDAKRPIPIVLVSRGIQDDLPLIDSEDLSEVLSGVAKVYELADKWSSFRLTEELGKPLSCFGGAVRIYWPRFNADVDAFAHPIWMPWQFKDAETTQRTLRQLRSMIFDAAAFRHIEPAPITHARAFAERLARETLRGVKDKSSDELLTDLITMEEKLKSIEAANTELARDNQTLRDNLSVLVEHSPWREQDAIEESPGHLHAEPDTPRSVAEAVTFAEAKATAIRFLPSAHASSKESPYKQPERVLQALLALDEVARIWAESVSSVKPMGSVRELFKKRGFEYADDVSQTTKGKWGGEYVAEHEGQQIDISPHITIGAKQADTCLSIHWAWHKEDKIALVAHVGRHKTNTKS